MGVKFTLHEPGENTQWTGVWTRYTEDENLTGLPENNKVNPGKGEGINARVCEGGGEKSTHAKQSYPTVQSTTHMVIQITIGIC
jgi:hypothetical protein